MFCGNGQGGSPVSLSAGGKPFVIPETGAAFHVYFYGPPASIPNPGAGRVAIKQAWWRQLLNPEFLAKFPKLKAIGTFEFSKPEETAFRDFTIMGDTGTGVNSPAGNDCGVQDGPTLAALQSDLRSSRIDSMIIWANYTGEGNPMNAGKDGSSTGGNSNSGGQSSNGGNNSNAKNEGYGKLAIGVTLLISSLLFLL